MIIHQDDQERLAERERDEFVARYSRRGFLGRLGLGAGAVGAVAAGVAGVGAPHYAHAAPATNFGRLFPGLPPFQPADELVRQALRAVGAPGGIMDAGDNLAAGPVALIVDAALNVNNPNNDSHAAGTTFMGQFMDHDMTFDTTSVLGVPTDPASTRNTRIPTFDLDSVYLLGPTGSPHLYTRGDRAKLRVGSVADDSSIEDLPRDSAGNAIIGDPRNDENVILAGLHAAVLKFHNNMVDLIRSERRVADTNNSGAVFEEARNQTRWHYQYLILNEFLPLFVGQSMVDDVMGNGRRFYRPPLDGAFMPVEFQGAVFRFGHTMVRPSYRANFTGQPAGKPNSPQFFGFIFDPQLGDVRGDREDLLGGTRSPRRFIGWTTFFRFPGFEADTRPNKRIDTKISTPLMDLPLFTIASGDQPTSLPQRNLLRHLTWSIPSGQAIAREMGIGPLDRSELHDIGRIGQDFKVRGLDESTPLWFYIFREAEHRANSMTLGPVGGRICAEVIIGLLQSDQSSFLNKAGGFQPIAPKAGSEFQMTDFLTFAGVAGKR
jgi:Animal haem peroxidase